MNLQQFEDLILNSTEDDWSLVMDGPLGPSDFRVITEDGQQRLDVRSHCVRAGLKEDLAVTMAWGRDVLESVEFDWLEQYPDKTASSHHVEFFYNGALVFRDLYVLVDGGGGSVPMPRTVQSLGEITEYQVTSRRKQFFDLLNALNGPPNISQLVLEPEGFVFVDGPWMV